MKKSLFVSAISLFCMASQAQNQWTEPCAYNPFIQYQENLTPGLKKAVDANYLGFINRSQTLSKAPTLTHTIPVVVHVVYSDTAANLPDSVILNQIEVLNTAYMRLNPDTVNLRDTFRTVVGKVNFKFQLADFDPNEAPTTGITRTSTNQIFGDGGNGFTPNIQDIEDVKSTANGGIDPWDQSKYLNIWVCDMSGGSTPSLLGYATPPPNLANWPAGSTDNMNDGVVIQFQSFGSNNPNPLNIQGNNLDVRGRTTVHEVGHYFGIRHTAEQSFFGSSCSGNDDGLKDTPNMAQSQFDCDQTRNSCADTVITYYGDTLGDLPDMIENYMDYSSEACQNTFTLGQIAIMRSVSENERVTLLNNGVLDTTTTVSTSIKNNFDVNNFDLYPNPSESIFTIRFATTNKNNISIYNSVGQLIYHRKMNTNKATIDLSDFPKGTYILNIQNEKSSTVKKLIKN